MTDIIFQGVMDGEAIAEAFEQRHGKDQRSNIKDELYRKIWSAVIANRSSDLRFDFAEKQSDSFWSSLREAIDPLFHDIVLV